LLSSLRIEEVEPGPGVRVLEVHGEVDLAVASQLQKAIERALDADRVLVDLAGCDFLDSTGIAVLIRGREALATSGGELSICNPGRQVLRVLEVTGLTRLDGFVADRPPDPAGSLSASQKP
jgi:anti-anti-sigma factor